MAQCLVKHCLEVFSVWAMRPLYWTAPTTHQLSALVNNKLEYCAHVSQIRIHISNTMSIFYLYILQLLCPSVSTQWMLQSA